MPPGHNISTAQQVFQWVSLVVDVGMAAWLAIGFVRRKRAGRVLFDLGRISERSGQIVAGCLFIVSGFFGVLVSRDFRWPSHIFYILGGLNSIALAMQRFLICEAGILSSERAGWIRLYRWDDITGYNVENGKLRLQLRSKSPRGERWITCCPRVRLDYQEELDGMLATRCARLKVPVGV